MEIILLALYAANYTRVERTASLYHPFCQLLSHVAFISHNRSKDTGPSQIPSTRAKLCNMKRAAREECRRTGGGGVWCGKSFIPF